jgi:hypothetical protein
VSVTAKIEGRKGGLLTLTNVTMAMAMAMAMTKTNTTSTKGFLHTGGRLG